MLQTLASPLNVRVVQEAATHVGSEYVLTLGAHAQRGLGTLRSLLFKGTNFCVFCDLEKFAKFKDRKIYAACASDAALYSVRTLRAR